MWSPAASPLGASLGDYLSQPPAIGGLGLGTIGTSALFLLIILGSTDPRAPAGFAPIAIGLALTLIHLIGIPVTNLSVNPARSTGPAVFVGGWALAQLWLFWVAPIAGAALAGATYRLVAGPASAQASGS